MRSSIALAAVFALGTLACGGGYTPSPTPTPSPTFTPLSNPVYAVFPDPNSSLMTQEVRDSQGDIVRFDTVTGSMVWDLDKHPFSGFPVLDTYYIRADRFFQVRFGTDKGERRAYFTEAGRGTLCDIVVSSSGTLTINPTDLPVPGS